MLIVCDHVQSSHAKLFSTSNILLLECNYIQVGEQVSGEIMLANARWVDVQTNKTMIIVSKKSGSEWQSIFKEWLKSLPPIHGFFLRGSKFVLKQLQTLRPPTLF